MKSYLKSFPSESYLIEHVDRYFMQIEGIPAHEEQLNKSQESVLESRDKKTAKPQAEPATIAGLALYLGFNSREEFEAYESRGKFAAIIKRACLRVEAAYEKKLHQQSSSGAIFALKNLGWNEKPDTRPSAKMPKTIKIKIIESGPKLAPNEKEVIL